MILGISPDSEASHQQLIAQHDLPFTLLCDPDKKVMTRYEAFGEKKMYGKVVKVYKKYKAHDENNECRVGDTVEIVESRPMSRTKRWRLVRVLQAGEMAGDLVGEISDFFLQADRARKPTDLEPVVRDTMKLIRDILPATVELEIDLEPCGPVLATTTGVQQVLMNLLLNAAEATRNTGTVTISTRAVRTGFRRTPRVSTGAVTSTLNDSAPPLFGRELPRSSKAVTRQ